MRVRESLRHLHYYDYFRPRDVPIFTLHYADISRRWRRDGL